MRPIDPETSFGSSDPVIRGGGTGSERIVFVANSERLTSSSGVVARVFEEGFEDRFSDSAVEVRALTALIRI